MLVTVMNSYEFQKFCRPRALAVLSDCGGNRGRTCGLLFVHRLPVLQGAASLCCVLPCAGMQAFEDIDGLLEGPEGFDSSTSVWHQTGKLRASACREPIPAAGHRGCQPLGDHEAAAASALHRAVVGASPAEGRSVLRARSPLSPGWREVAALRRKLEDLRELRELVRQLGRGGGKGPLKKAPEQVGCQQCGPHGVPRVLPQLQSLPWLGKLHCPGAASLPITRQALLYRKQLRVLGVGPSLQCIQYRFRSKCPG